MGFGLPGLAKRLLAYPSFRIWLRSLVTVALNQSPHNAKSTFYPALQHNNPHPEENQAVPGPFNTLYNMSRYRFFLVAFAAMFVYFWFPDHIVSALSLFNWMAWIAPANFTLTAITSVKKDLGFNPLPTFNWNIGCLPRRPGHNYLISAAFSSAIAIAAVVVFLCTKLSRCGILTGSAAILTADVKLKPALASSCQRENTLGRVLALMQHKHTLHITSVEVVLRVDRPTGWQGQRSDAAVRHRKWLSCCYQSLSNPCSVAEARLKGVYQLYVLLCVISRFTCPTPQCTITL